MVTDLTNMIEIPESSFQRGSLESPDEQPVAVVALSSYFIDATPVLNVHFNAFIEAGGYRNQSLWTRDGWTFITNSQISEPLYWHDSNWNGDLCPVTGISWWEALAFARFVGKGLPTEAQWEFAARGLGAQRFPWGDDEPTPEFANFAPGSEPSELIRKATRFDAHPKNRSPFGCVDMAGNLAEWCLDNYYPNYQWDITRKDPIYLVDEQGDHVARGGSGLHDEGFLRCSSRDSYPPTVRDNIAGLRCVYPPAQAAL
jgi:iron(II)-dependent oxidoreductase